MDSAQLAARDDASHWSAENFEAIATMPNRHLFEYGDEMGFFVFDSFLKGARLLNIVIYPEYRGEGHGQAAMREFEQRAHDFGARVVYLEVRDSNIPARGLYASRGYTRIRDLPGHYDDGEDGILLKKSLR